MQKLITILYMLLLMTGTHAQSLVNVKGQIRKTDTRVNVPFALILNPYQS